MYIDAKLINGKVMVSERDEHRNRHIKEYLPPYTFYYVDQNGRFKSIYGDSLKRIRVYNKREFFHLLKTKRESGKEIFESDINVSYRILEEKYKDGSKTPQLQISFLDIEVDKDPSRGWSRVNNPYAEINAVTIHNVWENSSYTIILVPDNMTEREARNLLDSEKGNDIRTRWLIDDEPFEDDDFGPLTEDNGYFLVNTEQELLILILELIKDSDCISGWNSMFFDLPYLIQRIRLTLGGENLSDLINEDGSENNPYDPSSESRKWLNKLNLFDETIPKLKMVERFGGYERVFELMGRVHLDYLELYRKFTFEELHSYTLDFVLQREIKESKVPVDLPLDQLYRRKLRTFAAYNRQDVEGMVNLDKKLKMIELANTMVHMAGVTFDKVFGSVTIIEQAILRRLHDDGLICFNRVEKDDEGSVPGAFVVPPHAGLYEWVVSYDFNSLYPTMIRLINISPEVIIGQFKPDLTDKKMSELFDIHGTIKDAWGELTGVLEYHNIIDKESDIELTFEVEHSNESITMSSKEWKKVLRENNWSISANGTVFDLSREGIVSVCLTEWYEDRVKNKSEAKRYRNMAKETKDKMKKKEYIDLSEYYDMVQLVNKIFLNSTYGAYLNRYFRFYDPRLGKSVTLSGRVMTKHLCKRISELLCGSYDFDRRVIIYGDTDSAYCTLDWFMKEKKIDTTITETVKLADNIGDTLNGELPKFCDSSFLVGSNRGNIVEAGREVVARRGLFKDKKKRYALHVVNNEGEEVDKLKIIGMETRRSDTPKFIQDFLETSIRMIVKESKEFEELKDYVSKFREEDFYSIQPWQRGTPGRVSKLTVGTKRLESYQNSIDKGIIGVKKPVLHHSVVASKNTNKLIDLYTETRWDYIRDGDKIIILDLLPNQYGFHKVAFKVGETYVPDWFQQLPFDDANHEKKLIDQKLQNVIGSVLGWNFQPPVSYADEVFSSKNFF